MTDRSASTRASLLLVHDDSDLLDALTRVFEARGYEVAIAATGFALLARLDSGREYDAVIAGWDSVQGLGRFAYQWVLDNRYDLRGQFVFLAREAPADFDEVVHGRCLLLYSYDFEEIVRVTEAMVERGRYGEALELVEGAGDQPTLLLVEDDTLQLGIMRSLLAHVGFSVTVAESGQAAMDRLQEADFDVILSDWYMANGSGADLYEWITSNRPHLASRCVFMSAALPAMAEMGRRAPGRPWIPKGQDSPSLISHLRSIADQSARWPRTSASGAA